MGALGRSLQVYPNLSHGNKIVFAEFMLEDHAVELQKKKRGKISPKLPKFVALCPAAVVASFGVRVACGLHSDITI